MDNANANFLVRYLFKRLLNCFRRAANVCLYDDVKLLNTLGDLCEEVVEVCSCICLELFLFCLRTSLVGKGSCHSLVLNSVELVSCERNLVKTDDLNRNRGTCLFELLTVMVGHSSYTAYCRTCYNDISAVERT